MTRENNLLWGQGKYQRLTRGLTFQLRLKGCIGITRANKRAECCRQENDMYRQPEVTSTIHWAHQDPENIQYSWSIEWKRREWKGVMWKSRQKHIIGMLKILTLSKGEKGIIMGSSRETVWSHFHFRSFNLALVSRMGWKGLKMEVRRSIQRLW